MSGGFVAPIDLEVVKRAEALSDVVYDFVLKWPEIARSTFGRQLIRSCDSIGANLVEGAARGTDLDMIRFWRIARSSGEECCFWLRRADARRVLGDHGKEVTRELDEVLRMLNSLIAARQRKLGKVVKEELQDYDLS